MSSNFLDKQRGSAIIMALLIVAISALLSTALLMRQQIDINTSRELFSAEQAYFAAQVMQTRAIEFLKADLQTHQITTWPKRLPKLIIPGGEIQAILWDAQGRYNLNNLRNPSNQASFRQLLQLVVPTLDVATAQEIAANVTDWLAPESEHSAKNTNYYSQQQPPYREAHQAMVSSSELRLVKGVTTQLYQQLAPFVIALPAQTLINLNAASAPVLVSAMPTLDRNLAEALVEQRNSQGAYLAMSDLTSNELVRGKNINTAQLSLTSDYYLLQIMLNQTNQHLILYSLLHRNNDSTKPSVDVLWQMQNL